MTPFYLILFVLILLALCDPYMKDMQMRVTMYIVLLIVLIFFAGFRRDNPDWHQYSFIFKEVVNHREGSHDGGFNAIVHACTYLTTEPLLMFLVTALIAVILNGISMCRYTQYFFTALLLYFCHNYCLKEMIQIRVGLASSICLFSLFYLYNKRLRVFFILMLIAVSIHLTSAIFILAYFSYKFLDKRTLLFCVVVALMIGVFTPLGAVLKTVLGIDERLDSYIAYGDDGYAQSLGIWTNLNTVKSLIVFMGLYHYYDTLATKCKYFEIMFKCYVAGLCWLICFNDFAIIGARMSNILMSVEPILLTYPFYLFKKKSRVIYSCIIIALAILIFHTNISPDKITPYKFYFS